MEEHSEPVDLLQLYKKDSGLFSEVLDNLAEQDEKAAEWVRRYNFIRQLRHEIGGPLNIVCGYLDFLKEHKEESFPPGFFIEDEETGRSKNLLLEEVKPFISVLDNYTAQIALGENIAGVYEEINLGAKEEAGPDFNSDDLIKTVIVKMEDILQEKKKCLQDHFKEVKARDEGAEKWRRIVLRNLSRSLEVLDFMDKRFRIEEGDYKSTSEAVKIDNFLEAAVKDVELGLERLAKGEKEKSLQIEINNENGVKQVVTDRALLSMVFKNLLENVAKYGHCRTQLTIGPENGRIVFTLKDEGIGITEEEMEHIGEKGFRAERAKQTGKGSGLGLDLTKEIVEKYLQGEIEIESEGKNKGTTVTLKLPNKPIIR